MITLARVLRAYTRLSLSERMHMLIRWRVCPLNTIAEIAFNHMPHSAQIIDLGCGHGLFSALLALDTPRDGTTRQILGVDLDAEKIACAKRLKLPNVTFTVGDLADAGFQVPPADLITILDVLYLLPHIVQENLLRACITHLNPGGVIVLKEMDTRPAWKLRMNILEETLAVRLFGITESNDGGRAFYFRSANEWHDLFGRLGMTAQTTPLDRGYYHPHLLVTARKVLHSSISSADPENGS